MWHMEEAKQERFMSAMRTPVNEDVPIGELGGPINNKRTESRQDFMQMPSNDVRERLSLLPVMMANERR